jgi:hypothetical protein
MYGSNNLRGSLAVIVLMVFTTGMLSSLLPGKQGALALATTILAYVLILGAEALLLCHLHYGETPKQLWQRVKTETDA